MTSGKPGRMPLEPIFFPGSKKPGVNGYQPSFSIFQPGILMLWYSFTKPLMLPERAMSRLTITLDDELHRALKEMAARQRRSIGSIIEGSLRRSGIQSGDSAGELVARARKAANLSPEEALSVAVSETRQARKEKQQH